MNLTKIVSNDNLRPALCVAILMNGYFYATNAHILIKIKASDGFDVQTDNKVLDLDLIKAIAKGREIIFQEDCVSIKKKTGVRFYPYSGTIDPVSRKMSMSRFSCQYDADDVNYPDIEAVINIKKRADLPYIGLNPSLLVDLNKGFVNNESFGAKLTFTSLSDGILVEPSESHLDQFGIIMPVNIIQP